MTSCFSGGPVVILDILYPQLSSKYGNFAVLGLIRCRILLIFEQNEGCNFDKNQNSDLLILSLGAMAIIKKVLFWLWIMVWP